MPLSLASLLSFRFSGSAADFQQCRLSAHPSPPNIEPTFFVRLVPYFPGSVCLAVVSMLGETLICFALWSLCRQWKRSWLAARDLLAAGMLYHLIHFESVVGSRNMPWPASKPA